MAKREACIICRQSSLNGCRICWTLCASLNNHAHTMRPQLPFPPSAHLFPIPAQQLRLPLFLCFCPICPGIDACSSSQPAAAPAECGLMESSTPRCACRMSPTLSTCERTSTILCFHIVLGGIAHASPMHGPSVALALALAQPPSLGHMFVTSLSSLSFNSPG